MCPLISLWKSKAEALGGFIVILATITSITQAFSSVREECFDFMFCSDILIRGQGAQLAPFIPWIRRWLIFGSFTPGCVLLGNGVLPLYLPSPSWNCGPYPEFPFIHPFWLFFPYTLNPGEGIVLPFSPSHPFSPTSCQFLAFVALHSPFLSLGNGH